MLLPAALAAPSCSGGLRARNLPPRDIGSEPDRSLDHRIQELLGDRGRRDAAREALIAAGSEAVPALIERIDDPEFTVRWEVVNILGYIGDPTAAAAIARQATHDGNPHVRWRGYWALSALRGEGARRELQKWLEEGNERVSWNAAVGLTLFDDRSVLSRLVAGVDHPDSWRRWEAVNALRRIADESVVPTFGRLLETGDTAIRQEVVLGLGSLPGPHATRLLLDALDDPSGQVRWRAVMGLSRRLDTNVRRRLEALRQRESDPLVLDQLGKLPGDADAEN